jgi:hypothetical protein
MHLLMLIMLALVMVASFLGGLWLLAQVCIFMGLGAEMVPAKSRAIIWPFYLLMALILLPGLLFGFMLYGFLRPPFGAHLLPKDQQSRSQRGLNGFLEILTGRPASAESS